VLLLIGFDRFSQPRSAQMQDVRAPDWPLPIQASPPPPMGAYRLARREPLMANTAVLQPFDVAIHAFAAAPCIAGHEGL